MKTDYFHDLNTLFLSKFVNVVFKKTKRLYFSWVEHHYLILNVPVQWKFYKNISLPTYPREYIKFRNFPPLWCLHNVYQADRIEEVSQVKSLNLYDYVGSTQTHAKREDFKTKGLAQDPC